MKKKKGMSRFWVVVAMLLNALIFYYFKDSVENDTDFGYPMLEIVKIVEEEEEAEQFKISLTEIFRVDTLSINVYVKIEKE